VTEQEWLIGDDPQAMLAWLAPEEASDVTVPSRAWMDRKLRLYACACCRLVWHLLIDDRSRRAVEVAEKFADGLATETQLSAAKAGAHDAYIEARAVAPEMLSASECCDPEIAALTMLRLSVAAEERGDYSAPALQASLLRDIAGNPFLPAYRGRGTMFTEEGAPILWERHITPTAVSLAQAAYAGDWGRACGRCKGKGRVCAGMGTPYDSAWEKCPDCAGRRPRRGRFARPADAGRRWPTRWRNRGAAASCCVTFAASNYARSVRGGASTTRHTTASAEALFAISASSLRLTTNGSQEAAA
jgi:hypothetical protein